MSEVNLLFSAITMSESLAHTAEQGMPTPFHPSHWHFPRVVPGAQQRDCTSVPEHTVLTVASTPLFATSPLACVTG